MRRSFLLSAAIAWAASLATATQASVDDGGGIMLHNLLGKTPSIQLLTRNSTTTSSPTERLTDPTLPKLAQMHVPQSELQVLFSTTSSFSAVPQINEVHQSKGALLIPRPTAVLQPGLQAIGVMGSGLITTPKSTSAAIITKGPSTTPVASNFSTPVQTLDPAEIHSLQTDGLRGGLGALGQMTGGQSKSPTSTTLGVLMSGFVFKGTTYPPLPLATMSSAEQHSSQTDLSGPAHQPSVQPAVTTTPTSTTLGVLMSGFVFKGTTYPPLPLVTMSSAEQHSSQTDLIGSTHQPSAKPADTTSAITTTPISNEGSANTDIISAFTFHGTAYPAIPLVPESAAAGYQSSQVASSQASAIPTTVQSQASPSRPADYQLIATATSIPLPNQQTGGSAGISVSGVLLPTTFGNIAGPSSSSSPVLPSPLSASTSLYISENPAGIPIVGVTTAPPFVGITGSAGGPQSLTTSRAYALATDVNGFVSLRPQVTGTGGGAIWGYVNGTGAVGTGVGNRTTAVVPFLSEGKKGRESRWWFFAAGTVSLGIWLV